MFKRPDYPILWFIITTGKCNLKCIYCGGSFPEKYVPSKPIYNIEKLKDIVKPYDTVVLYGGEPLLNIEFVRWIIQNLSYCRIGIQTNALLLKELTCDEIRKFDFILVSIDGIPEITNKYRGKFVYERVIESCKYIRKCGFRGELIARMTVTEDTDIYRDVTHLLKLGIFDKIHWQLNVIWCEKWNFIEWAYKKYLPGIKQLIKFFIDNSLRGNVFKIVPFTGILTAYFKDGFNHIPCGAGKYAFTINTNGKILACPIAVRENWAIVGDVDKGIEKILEIRNECRECKYFKYCGGRCLYTHYELNWGIEGFYEVCEITKEFIELVLSVAPIVEKLIDRKIIMFEDIFQDPLKDSTEVIP